MFRVRRSARAAAIVVAALSLTLGAAVGVAAPGASSGTLLAFGLNEFGELGRGANLNTGVPNGTPELVPLPGAVGDATQMASGLFSSLVLTTSGQVYAFGNNFNGELGNAGDIHTGTPHPQPAAVALPGLVGTAVQIAAGSYHSLVLTSSGQLYGFGSNGWGQIARPSVLEDNPTPELVTLPGQVGTVTQIAGGRRHTLVVTSGNQLYAFGQNLFGQLGIGSTSGANYANPTPALVTLPGAVGTIEQVSAGGEHSLVLMSSGQVYAFGSNRYGQLGNPANTASDTPNPTPTLVTLPGQVGTVTQISAGMAHSLVATSGGQVYAFGLNDYAQLGSSVNNGTQVANPAPAPVTLAGQSGSIAQLSAGFSHSLALTSSGQLFGFGRNEYGALGGNPPVALPSLTPLPTIVPFTAGTTINELAVGGTAYHSLVLAAIAVLTITSDHLLQGQTGTPYLDVVQSAGGVNPLRWSADGLPSGLTIDPATGRIDGTTSSAGSFSPTVTLADGAGTRTTRILALTVAASREPPPAPAAPRLSGLKQSAAKWALGRHLAKLGGATGAAKKAGMPVGTTFSFSLDRAARVTFAFLRPAAGRIVGGKCVAPTTANNRKRHCKRTVREGSLQVQAKQGASRLRFEGRVDRSHKLKPGVHTVRVSATSAAGKSSSARALTFTIVGR